MTNIISNTISGPAIPIRRCPFCGSEARLVVAHDQVCRAVQCSNCSASVPPALGTEFEALFRWNRRNGGAAAAGGRATKGLTSAKKRRACRKNLALARQSKRLKAICAKTDEAIARLRPYREAEQRELDAQRERTSARLAALVPRLEADPGLRGMVELLKPHLNVALRYKHEEAPPFTVRTDSNSNAATCQVQSSTVLTPSADGSIALRWAKQTGGGTSGPTLKKGSRVRATVAG